jgi:signal peptidase I
MGLAVILLVGGLALVSGCGGGEATERLKVPSEAMEPTIKVNGHIEVDRDAYKRTEPKRGDIVVLHPPIAARQSTCGAPRPRGAACARLKPQEDTSVEFVQRIVAGPGDRLSVKGGHTVINGKQLDEPYIRPCRNDYCDLPLPIVIPAGHWFLMGDNRGASDDSRFWGPVPADWILGTVVKIHEP